MFDDEQCLLECPFYFLKNLDVNPKICENCYETCKTCNVTLNETSCLSCDSSYYPFSSTLDHFIYYSDPDTNNTVKVYDYTEYTNECIICP